MQIKGFIKNTLIDWEGKIASEIFTPGCNFRCPFCHSPQLVLEPDSGNNIPEQEVIAFHRANREWIDGLVITGGEPTLAPGLMEFLQRIKDEGIPVKIDSNGAQPNRLAEIIERELIQYVAMDVKAPAEKYERLAGVPVDTDKINESIRLLIDGKIGYEFRTTITPTMDLPDDIVEIARWIQGAKLYYLQGFRGGNCLDPAHNNLPSIQPETVRECARAATEFVRDTRVRGEAPDNPPQKQVP